MLSEREGNSSQSPPDGASALVAQVGLLNPQHSLDEREDINHLLNGF